MGNKKRKYQQSEAEDKKLSIRTIVASGVTALPKFVWFVLGIVFSLAFIPWFVTMLPGPKATASVHGLRATTGNGVGCIYYSLDLVIDDPIEFVYMKVQFPSQIENYKVGFPNEAELTDNRRTSMQLYEAGRNADGRCAVIQSAGDNNPDVQASASGHMIALHASKLPPKTTISTLVATDEKKSSARPIPKMYTEGSYEYIKLGQTVRKPISFSDRGISDAK